MENKEVFTVVIVLAVLFAFLSVFSGFAITGSAVKELGNSLSLTFSLITIVLILIILISLIIELTKFSKN